MTDFQKEYQDKLATVEQCLSLIHSGDIVFIRRQPTVDEGEIAAVLIDGEAFRLTRAKDVVRLPSYTDYAELRNNLKGFVLRAEKDKDKEPFCLMGMVETFEVFHLLYVPEAATFYLTLCSISFYYNTTWIVYCNAFFSSRIPIYTL